MKTFFALMIVFFVFSGYAQKPVQKEKAQDDAYYDSADNKDSKSGNLAPKKTYEIVVKNELTADQNFTLVGQTLADNDFVIDVKDKEFKTIKTASKNLDNTARGLRLIFSIRDHEISITGQGTVASFSQPVIMGQGGSFIQKCFAKMQEFAMKLGSNLEYITD